MPTQIQKGGEGITPIRSQPRRQKGKILNFIFKLGAQIP